jgi:hypothetical protein
MDRAEDEAASLHVRLQLRERVLQGETTGPEADEAWARLDASQALSRLRGKLENLRRDANRLRELHALGQGTVRDLQGAERSLREAEVDLRIAEIRLRLIDEDAGRR